MHRMCIILLLVSISLIATAHAENGLISLKSNHSVKVTADRLESTLNAKGMKVFNRIDHQAGAKGVGIDLRPTELLIFGNPKVGAPLMQCGQTVAIDLPQKALIWEDAGGSVWVSYNDPHYLASRHSIGDCGQVLDKVRNALNNFATAATGP